LGRTIRLQIADLNVGVLFILAFSSLTVYGIVLGGWASRSKYPLLGGLRSSAQLISYEIPLGLSIIPILMITSSMRLSDVVTHQTGTLPLGLPAWNIFLQPLAFIIFTVSLYAELNRLPFDLPETEQELVGGYITEYSSMKFAFFMLGEYFGMVTGSMLMVTLFFGGWHVPGLQALGLGPLATSLIQVAAFVVKTGIVIFTFLWTRWTLPRFRFDQLMGLGWKVLIPLALVNIGLTGAYIVWRG
jgi:NADH-quinone oxidoreductase subunit H